MKELVRQKKLTMWKDVVEKANADFEGSRRKFWAFVGRRTKAKNRGIASLKGVSVTSTKGKLELLQKHYEHLGRVMLIVILMMIAKGGSRVKWQLVLGCQGHVTMLS